MLIQNPTPFYKLHVPFYIGHGRLHFFRRWTGTTYSNYLANITFCFILRAHFELRLSLWPFHTLAVLADQHMAVGQCLFARSNPRIIGYDSLKMCNMFGSTWADSPPPWLCRLSGVAECHLLAFFCFSACCGLFWLRANIQPLLMCLCKKKYAEANMKTAWRRLKTQV